MTINPSASAPTARALPQADVRPISEPKTRFSLNRSTRGIVVRQVLLQLFLLLVLATVMFPVLWILSMAIDPRGVARPTDLNLLPANATLEAFNRLLTEPITNTFNVYFGELLLNSMFIALGVAVFTVTVGASAAYAFSRFRFIGRQFGMLTFIILLMLPSTGTLIPLYIMFNSVRASKTLTEFFPALFAGALVGGSIAIVFTIVRNLGKRNPERLINLPPAVIAAATALFSLFAIGLATYIIVSRTPLYDVAINQPIDRLASQLDAAEADFYGQQDSIANYERTAGTRERNAALAAEDAALIGGWQAQIADVPDDQLIVTLQPLVDGFLAEPDDLYPQRDDIQEALFPVRDALAAGDAAAARAAFDEALLVINDEAARVASGAAAARANADEAIANLDDAQAALDAATAEFEANAATYYNLRTNALLGLLPLVLLAWVGALAGAAALWLLTRVLSGSVRPMTVINVLLLALVGALILGVTLQTLQYRVGLIRADTLTLRETLLGLALAFSSGGVPFAVWNLKGYFDTIPKELEEAALIDGAGLVTTFFRVMVPLALPAFAIVILFSFMNGWTEFILSWSFLTGQTQNYTLAMSLASFTGGGNAPPPDMQKFAALSILISLPILVLFFSFQRWIVGGLSIGGVKG
jgi:ABC-type maltose transport system permease subunit